VIRPMYWTSRFLKVIGAARKRVSSAGQSKPSPMNELVPTINSGSESGARLASSSAIWRRSRALIAPLKTVTVLPAARARSAMALRWSTQVVRTRMVEAVFISNESAVDLRHSTWGAGIGVAGVPESSRMQAKNRLRCE